jgi:hypothetical protein
MEYVIVLKAGRVNCASEPGVFCRFKGLRRYGTIHHCNLFDERLYDDGGSIKRCDKCLSELQPAQSSLFPHVQD